MKKVVINGCHGGFNLSDKGIKRYAAGKGLVLYPEQERSGLTTYWTIPQEDRGGILSGDEFYAATTEARRASNEKYSASNLYSRDIQRDDPVLIQVIEELGSAADGRCAALQIVEIPDNVEWEIEEYDGAEWISEVHRRWP